MGEKVSSMRVKETTAILLASCLIVWAGGCETAKGAAQGLGSAMVGTVAGVSEGAVKDTKNLWQAILKADEWFQENLW